MPRTETAAKNYTLVSGGELAGDGGRVYIVERKENRNFFFVCVFMYYRRLMNDSRVAAVLYVMCSYTLYKYMYIYILYPQRMPPIYTGYNIFALVDSVLLRGVCMSVVQTQLYVYFNNNTLEVITVFLWVYVFSRLPLGDEPKN